VIGRNIAQAREAKGLSLAQCAKRANVSQRELEQWEAGACAPHADEALRLADVCGVTLDDLLGL
jgi:transcriptional regulator with XRE-family HTH domain